MDAVESYHGFRPVYSCAVRSERCTSLYSAAAQDKSHPSRVLRRADGGGGGRMCCLCSAAPTPTAAACGACCFAADRRHRVRTCNAAQHVLDGIANSKYRYLSAAVCGIMYWALSVLSRTEQHGAGLSRAEQHCAALSCTDHAAERAPYVRRMPCTGGHESAPHSVGATRRATGFGGPRGTYGSYKFVRPDVPSGELYD